MIPQPQPPATRPRLTLPAGIWALGFVSLFMDISSEMAHSLLPLFMATTLGASMAVIGAIEGMAEATATLTKALGGAASDRLGRRKLLAVIGYALGAASKPILPLAHGLGWLSAARFVDRLGKGIRGAPRDALVADLAPGHLRGAAYGLRQALDATGALAGPLLAVACMAWLANDIRAVLWVAVVPGFIAVAVLVLGVHEPARSPAAGAAHRALPWRDMWRLPGACWYLVGLGAVLALARFSEAFLVLRGRDVGLGAGFVPLMLVAMNVVYAAAAYPAGVAADRVDRRGLLLSGLGVLVLADLALAAADSPWLAFVGAGLWGGHLALTQGLLAKLVADAAPVALRGTAFGVFHLAGGGALLLASVLAGALWSAYGAPATFLAGAAFALLAAVGLLAAAPRSRPLRSGT